MSSFAPKTPVSAGKRSRHDDVDSSNKRSTPKSKDDGGTQKASKGLRHFSMKVCKKVEEKGHTSYNEVADELVKEFMAQRAAETSSPTPTTPTPGRKGAGGGGVDRPAYDEKNIRRRVYDALNVLMAMDIISKEKKEITWKGLPNNATHDLEMLQRERDLRRKELRRKRECLQELLVQQVCYRNLVNQNRQRETTMDEREKESTISLPFIVVSTNHDAEILCEALDDWNDVMLDFSDPFEINDDNEILKRLGLDKTTYDELAQMLPRDLLRYCEEHNLLDPIVVDADPRYQRIQSPGHMSDYDPDQQPPQPIQHSSSDDAHESHAYFAT